MSVGIVDEDIIKVRESSDIVAVISQFTQLRRVGRRYQGLCPFHSEKTASFSVNDQEGLYYCFGCGAKGDVITFIREKEQLDFVGAVETLANKASISLRYTDKNESADRKRQGYLQNLVLKAADWYHKNLLEDDDAGPARAYLRSRGYDSEVVKRYQIGWAPDDWDRLAKFLKVGNKDLQDAGLGFVNRRGRQQDFFRARIMFPVFNVHDKAVGFGGRIMPEAAEQGPKYKNSADSQIYTKSRLLYALNWAKAEIVNTDQVLICEGYTDVIGFAGAGMPQAVATCGTALTEEHFKLLSRFSRNIVLAFDADSAGENAALRFYQWEKTYDVNVAVADLPAGKDPGELASTDPVRLREAVKNAKPFLGFRIEKALSEADFSSVETRAKAANEVLKMVAEHPDSLVRDQYVVDLASRLRLQPELLRSQLGNNNKVAVKNFVAKKRNVLRDHPEKEALKILLNNPDSITTLLVPELFSDPIYARAYEHLSSSESLHEAIEKASEQEVDLLHELSVETSDADPVDVAALLWHSYLNILMDNSRRSNAGNQVIFNADTVAQHTWMRLKLEELRDPSKQQAVVTDLVAWLKQGTGEG